tara:strand:- start:1100 stop:1306 length:207 start_codon:yes stop_codon:yes gene_type:complete
MSDILAMTTNTEGLFNWCMRAGTPEEILVFLCDSFREAPAGLLLEFAERKKTPVFKDNAIVGFEAVDK